MYTQFSIVIETLFNSSLSYYSCFSIKNGKLFFHKTYDIKSMLIKKFLQTTNIYIYTNTNVLWFCVLNKYKKSACHEAVKIILSVKSIKSTCYIRNL